LGRRAATDLRAGPRTFTSGSDRSARNCPREKYSDAALQRFAARLPPGPKSPPLSQLGFVARLLRVLGESRWEARFFSLRLSRRSATKTFRLHLHRLAAGEFLARRLARPGERPPLYPSGCACGTRFNWSR